MHTDRPGTARCLTGEGRTRVRLSSLAVLAAFLLGIGPGAQTQPCPRHSGMHGGHAGALPSLGASHATQAPAHANRHGDHEQAARPDGPTRTHSHPDSEGPCDCLGSCLTCCGPAVAGSSPRGIPSTPASAALRVAPLREIPAIDAAAHLRPPARAPPA